MASVREFSRTLQLIYDAGIDFDQWPVALERLADMIGASVACLVRQDYVASEGQMIMVRTDPRFSQLYSDHYAKINPLAQRAGNRPPQTCISDRMFMEKDELIKTEFFDGFMRPQNVHSLLNLFLLSEGDRGTRIALARSPRAGEWESEHIELLHAVAPHAYRAALINRTLEVSRLGTEGTIAGINRLAEAVFAVDAECRLLFMNEVGDRVLSEADGLKNGADGVSTARPAETEALRQMVAEAATCQITRASRCAIDVTRPRNRSKYSLLVLPLRLLPGWFLGQRAGAIIFVRNSDRPVSTPAPLLRQYFSLTRAEVAVTMQIARGRGLQSAADEIGISITTARTHLSRIFQKTGTHRQSELVRLVVEMQTAPR